MREFNETKVAQLFIICMQFASIYSSSNLAKILPASYFTNFAYGVSILCIFLKYIALKEKFSISSFVNLLIMGFVAYMGFSNARGALFLELLLYILVLKETNEIKVIKTLLITKAAASLFIFFAALLGFGDLYVAAGGARSFSFGFSNNNFVGGILFDISMAAMILHYYEHQKTFIISIIAAALFCFFVIDCRAAVICFVAVLLLLAVGEGLYKYKVIRGTTIILFEVFTIISYLGAVFLPRISFLSQLNMILSHRLETWFYYFTNMRPALFGNRFYTAQLLALDNAYLYTLMRYGIIIFVIHCLLFNRMTAIYMRKNSVLLLVATISYEIYGLVESSSITVAHCVPFIYFISCEFFRSEEVTDLGY